MVSANPTVCVFMFPMRNFAGDALVPAGYEIKNETDQSFRCEPDFSRSCNDSEVGFLHLSHVEFCGYDIRFDSSYTFKRRENECLPSCNYYGFQYKFNWGSGFYNCYRKTLLFNGYCSPSFPNSITRKYLGATTQSYLQAAIGFRKFTYDELKKAAPIKLLNEANQREVEFFAKGNTIGRVNHMNPIEI
ncbi:hypothetical protein ACSBR1_000588 [Camellia fascicularis]